MAKEQVTYSTAWTILAVARILLGFVFLWAFLDKTFGLGFATTPAKAWVSGGSPTTGFLKSLDGLFAGFFNGLAGNVVVDWLFMLGLLGVGVALIVGAGLRIAAVSGAIILVMMWLAELPLTTNPFVDDHIVYAVLLFVIAAAPRCLSLSKWWVNLNYVKKHPWLW